jgi:hypothetical protein
MRRGSTHGPVTRGALRRGACVVVVVTLAALGACAPRARPLTGEMTTSAIPRTGLPSTPELYRFDWRYADETFEVRGEGVVRTGPPDRARLDLFIANGYGNGLAILEGDSLFVPGIDLIRRFLPPPPLLWATLGRVALPPGRDTVVRLDGDTLRADISGSERDARTWRVHFSGSRLARIERIEGARVVEWAERVPGDAGTLRLTYAHTTGRRTLVLSVHEVLTVNEGFDDAIWRKP